MKKKEEVKKKMEKTMTTTTTKKKKKKRNSARRRRRRKKIELHCLMSDIIVYLPQELVVRSSKNVQFFMLNNPRRLICH